MRRLNAWLNTLTLLVVCSVLQLALAGRCKDAMVSCHGSGNLAFKPSHLIRNISREQARLLSPDRHTSLLPGI